MSPLSPGMKENVQLYMKEFGQPSVKRDYTIHSGAVLIGWCARSTTVGYIFNSNVLFLFVICTIPT